MASCGILWALHIPFGAFHDGHDESFFLHVEQYEAAITGANCEVNVL